MPQGFDSTLGCLGGRQALTHMHSTQHLRAHGGQGPIRRADWSNLGQSDTKPGPSNHFKRQVLLGTVAC